MPRCHTSVRRQKPPLIILLHARLKAIGLGFSRNQLVWPRETDQPRPAEANWGKNVFAKDALEEVNPDCCRWFTFGVIGQSWRLLKLLFVVFEFGKYLKCKKTHLGPMLSFFFFLMHNNWMFELNWKRHRRNCSWITFECSFWSILKFVFNVSNWNHLEIGKKYFRAWRRDPSPSLLISPVPWIKFI